ncbi:DUF2330 domain-containing protein [Magnetococcales bacterium HHB-1]
MARHHFISGLFLILFHLISTTVEAFCGFYVAKADTALFNKASKVVIVRDEERTVLTMANDYHGEPSEFAMVIPVPTFISREQIHIGNRATLAHLDAYTAPRLVEYYDPNPCDRSSYLRDNAGLARKEMTMAVAPPPASAKSLGVTIEAKYSVGEYDILILSAEQSDGLTTWLQQEGYRLPDKARPVLGSYIRQDMRFFVAKVNLGKFHKKGYTFLRPLQVAYESRKFMLPIRLGTINAENEQELFVFILTRTGRVETRNYRTVKLPTGTELPPYIKNDFATFYRDMFAKQLENERRRAVFLEYAWDMNWCDPCAASPLSNQELRSLGVFWLDASSSQNGTAPPFPFRRRVMPPGPAKNVFVTRLHLRYNAQTFPEDLMFHETRDRRNFQGRYVLRHPWTGQSQCAEGERYRHDLRARQLIEASNLARLTGWSLQKIHRKIGLDPTRPPENQEPWWKNIWQN